MAGGTEPPGHSRADGEDLIDRLLALIGSLPVGLERLVQIALGRPTGAPRLVPRAALLLAVLAIVPVAGWLIELIVVPITIANFVDRRVGPSTTLVEMNGYALLIPFPAEAPANQNLPRTGDEWTWYVVRDDLQEERVALVRSPLTVEAIQQRWIVARVLDEPGAADAAVDAIVRSGRAAPSTGVAMQLLEEVERPQGEIRDLDSLARLSDVPAGSLVRVRLQFSGVGVATCAITDRCSARRLADGIGSWDSLASDPTGEGWVVIRTGYPPSEARFHGVGRQAEDRALVDRVLAPGWVQGLLGWAHALHSAHIEQDVNLPVDRLWLGPIIFATGAALLSIGRRLGYPRFRASTTSDRARRAPALGWADMRVRVTGRITPRGSSPLELNDAPAILRRPREGAAELGMQIDGIVNAVQIPHLQAALSSTTIGELIGIRSSRPALQIGWFGSQAQLVFEDTDARDAVAALLSEGTAH